MTYRSSSADGSATGNRDVSPGVHKRTPPSKHAMRCLSIAALAPFPAQEVNFTVRDKLILFGYARLEERPSPYKTHRDGRTVPYLVVTDAGRAALEKPHG